MKLSKEEFCRKYSITEDQFYGRVVIKWDMWFESLECLPEGCSLNVIGFIDVDDMNELPEGCSLVSTYNQYLNFIEELPEGCTLKSDSVIILDSLKFLPEEYSIEAKEVCCKIIVPTFKGSLEFYFGEWAMKRSFKDYYHIKESPLKYFGCEDPLEFALAEYFLKNPERFA